MDEFTAAERARIDGFYKNEFEGMTPDDVQLLTRWISTKTAHETAAEMLKEAQIAYLNSRAEEAREGAKLAQAQFERLVMESNAKWAGGDNGQAKQV